MGCQQGLAAVGNTAPTKRNSHHNTCTLPLRSRSAGDFGDTAVQGQLVHQLRYLASVVTQNFTSFGELLAMPKRFAEISGVCSRVGLAAFDTAGQVAALAGRWHLLHNLEPTACNRNCLCHAFPLARRHHARE